MTELSSADEGTEAYLAIEISRVQAKQASAMVSEVLSLLLVVMLVHY